MRYATIGSSGSSTLKSSKIILGTWQAGHKDWVGIDDNEIIKAIRGALELGISTIDTASVYGDGYSEKIIAKALSGVPRDQYQLATKVPQNCLKYDQVIKKCEESLANLKTPYIDLYQIHWPSGSWGSEVVPIQETMKALNDLQRSGKIRHIGVSNFSQKQIEEASMYGNIVSNQPPYSLIWRQYDRGANEYCRSNNMGILAYSPLAQGILTGKFKRGHQFAPGDHRSGNRLMQPEIFAKVETVLQGLQPYAQKYGTTIGNVALNWLISQPSTFAIVGVRNLSQLQESVKCCDFEMSGADLQAIDKLSHIVTDAIDQNPILWTDDEEEAAVELASSAGKSAPKPYS